MCLGFSPLIQTMHKQQPTHQPQSHGHGDGLTPPVVYEKTRRITFLSHSYRQLWSDSGHMYHSHIIHQRHFSINTSRSVAAFYKTLNQTLLCNTEHLMIWMEALLLSFKLPLSV